MATAEVGVADCAKRAVVSGGEQVLTSKYVLNGWVVQESLSNQPYDGYDPGDPVEADEDDGLSHDALDHCYGLDCYDLDDMCRASATAKQAAMQTWYTQHKGDWDKMKHVPSGLLQLVVHSSQY